jgi:hypothetical protein
LGDLDSRRGGFEPRPDGTLVVGQGQDREQVADCGFGGRSHPRIGWAKLKALSDGAARASVALAFTWGSNATRNWSGPRPIEYKTHEESPALASPTIPFGIRVRPHSPARHLPPRLSPHFAEMLERADTATSNPFVGVTTDGHVTPGLFSLRETGVSTRPLKDAADGLLASLTDAERSTATFPLDDAGWRRWSNVHAFIMRHGVLLESLTANQRALALGLLEATLSVSGFQTARDIMRLNHTIGELTDSWDQYGEWLYWLSIFGTPSLDEPWGWQFDGHHLNVNCLVMGDQVVMTPMLMGSEPTLAPLGLYAGTRVFDAEEQVALEFMRGLSEAQQRQAILYDSIRWSEVASPRWGPTEERIQAGAQRDNVQLPYEGMRADGLTPSQRDQLLALIEVYIGRMRPGHDRVRMAEVQAHLDQTNVLWFGGTADDSTFYYRIHSPVLLIEFDHLNGIALNNDEPERTHIHTVMRTPNGNDYGRDLLRQHYARFPH